MEDSNVILCPKCKSNQIFAEKRGYNLAKGIIGGVLTGGVGLIAGAHGNNKVVITCLACGHKFKPGEVAKPPIVRPQTTSIKYKKLLELYAKNPMDAYKFYEDSSKGKYTMVESIEKVENIVKKDKAEKKQANGCLIVASIIVIAILFWIFV